MDLYRKKVNLGSKQNDGQEDRYEDAKYNPPHRIKNIYFQKISKPNKTQNKEEPLESSQGGKNMDDFLSDENNRKNTSKYMNQKNRNYQSPDSNLPQKRLEKSASPKRRGDYEKEYGDESRGDSPNRKALNLSREPYYSELGRRFNTISNDKNSAEKQRAKNNIKSIKRNYYKNQNEGDDEEYYDKSQNYYYNPAITQNDNEFSSINGEDMPQGIKISRSPEPSRSRNNFSKIVKRPGYREKRPKDIQFMQTLRKPTPSTTIYTTSNNLNQNADEDVDELIRTIEDLQSIINGQKHEIRKLKKDNYNKEKENNMLKNELYELQKEIDDKRI